MNPDLSYWLEGGREYKQCKDSKCGVEKKKL